PLSVALTYDAFGFDAHFASYSVRGCARRLAYGEGRPRDLLFGAVAAVPLVLFVVDVEPGGHDAPMAESAWTIEKLKLSALLASHPGAFIYTTRHGYRVVYRLAAPMVLASPYDGEVWKAQYVAWLG